MNRWMQKSRLVCFFQNWKLMVFLLPTSVIFSCFWVHLDRSSKDWKNLRIHWKTFLSIACPSQIISSTIDDWFNMLSRLSLKSKVVSTPYGLVAALRASLCKTTSTIVLFFFAVHRCDVSNEAKEWTLEIVKNEPRALGEPSTLDISSLCIRPALCHSIIITRSNVRTGNS